jgi:hypothetical protein
MPHSSPKWEVMRALITMMMLAGFGCGFVYAEDVPKSVQVPLPRPRPPNPAGWTALHSFRDAIGPEFDAVTVPGKKVAWPEPHSFREAAGADFDSADMTDKPTPCDERLAGMAAFTPMPRLIGPGTCGGDDMVEIAGVQLPGNKRIAVEPAALLNCGMAESLASWLRDEVAPRVAALGSPLIKIENYDSYECRSRNRVPGAKISEHAHGEAIDIRAFRLSDGRRLELTDPHVDKPLRAALRESACHRFTTVLGPGDPYHEGHIHLDVIQRRNGYRICQWDVRDPKPEVATILIDGKPVPLPVPRPALPGDEKARNL